MTVRSRVLRGGIGLIIIAGLMVYNNPIRFHQTAHAGGLTMQVPSTWAPMEHCGPIHAGISKQRMGSVLAIGQRFCDGSICIRFKG